MLDVVEGGEIGEIEKHRVVRFDVGRDARGQALELADSLVGKISDRAHCEWRQAGQCSGAIGGARAAQKIEDVAGFFPALALRLTLRAMSGSRMATALHRDALASAADDLKRIRAEESVSANVLPAFYALEQEAVGASL